MKFYLGVDPGHGGGLAVLDEQGIVRDLRDPVLTKVGNKTNYDILAMWELLSVILDKFRTDDDPLYGVVEAAQARRGITPTSTFSQGYGLGMYETLFTAAAMPVERLATKVWRKGVGLPENTANLTDAQRKEASRQHARRMFPSVAPHLGRVKDHGRAEALLIAEARRRKG